jgi:GNAT superfamily N-acetyltransferase
MTTDSVSADLPIDLRPAVLTDIRAIAEFQTRCWHQAYEGLVPQEYLDRITVDERETRWRDRFLSGEIGMMLAEASSELVGVISWRMTNVVDAPPLELRTLYVDAAHHGRGVAAALTDAALGGRPAHVWVFEQNPRAHRFYLKQGFRADGCREVDADTGIWEIRMVRD